MRNGFQNNPLSKKPVSATREISVFPEPPIRLSIVKGFLIEEQGNSFEGEFNQNKISTPTSEWPRVKATIDEMMINNKGENQ